MRIGAQVGDAFTDDKSEYGLMMAGTVLAIVPILVRPLHRTEYCQDET